MSRSRRSALPLAGAALVVAAALSAVATVVGALAAAWWWAPVALRSWSSDPGTRDVDPSLVAGAERLSALAGVGAAVTVACLGAGLLCYRLSGRVGSAGRAGAR